MLKKTAVFAAAAVMTLTMLAAGCGRVEHSSMTMDTSNDKMATIEMSNAKEDEFVQGGYISVAEGDGVEIVSDLNDGGKVLIGFIEVEDDQSMEVLPEREDAKYEMMISNKATEGATLEPGEYDLKVTVQGKATGTVTLNVKPVSSIKGLEAVGDL